MKVWAVGGLAYQLDAHTGGAGCGKEDGIVRFDVDGGIIFL